jgi:hypothetical protein
LSFLLFAALFFSGCGPIFATTPEGNSSLTNTAGTTSPLKVERGTSMRVLWTVSEYKLGANAVWGKNEADKLLFKPIDIDASSITFDGMSCRNISFTKNMVNTKEYLDKYFHITPQALGIGDETIEVVKTDCKLPGFAEYLRLRDRRLIIQINGFFFFFEPAITY